MNLKKAQKLIICLWVAAVVCAVLIALTRDFWYVVIALAAMIAQVIVRLKYWRCPHCGKFLGKQLGPQHCRNCGQKVEL